MRTILNLWGRGRDNGTKSGPALPTSAVVSNIEKPEKPDFIWVVVFLIEGDVDEVRLYADREEAEQAIENDEEHREWVDHYIEEFHLPGNVEGLREELMEWAAADEDERVEPEE